MTEKNMQGKLFLFGTGKISRKYTKFLNQISIDIEGYIDNNKNKWGTCFYGKKIYEPAMLKKIEQSNILIACAAKEEISTQLSEMNLRKYIVSISQIIRCCSKEIMDKVCCKEYGINTQEEKTIIIDNLNGTWGGTEDWCHIVASSLINRRRSVYVVENAKQHYVAELTKRIMSINTDEKSEYDSYIELINLLMPKRPFILFNVRNSVLLWAAATIKVIYPKDVLIISNILNDAFYEEFCEWDESIDLYLCISSRVSMNLVSQYGIDKRKVRCRTPFIERIRKVNKMYQVDSNKPIRIGYPCRLASFQKRADLMLRLIMYLENKDINYLLNIAGNGPCETMIKEYVEMNHLNEKVKLFGKLSRMELFDFLDDQDVYVNISEFEGTSLTMLEAMASGCVPVVTDVSGVSDFIENEINGLIADVGDLEKIAEHLAYLDKNRHKLAEYGEKCMRVVQKKCNLNYYIDDIEYMIDSV